MITFPERIVKGKRYTLNVGVQVGDLDRTR